MAWDCNDHARIWDVLDKVRLKHPDMVLLHGASPRGAEFIASRWADTRKVAQVVFKPDWTRHAKRHHSSATISFCRPCRLVSSCFRDLGSLTIWPTRRRHSVFRCGVLEGAHNGAFPETPSPLVQPRPFRQSAGKTAESPNPVPYFRSTFESEPATATTVSQGAWLPRKPTEPNVKYPTSEERWELPTQGRGR